METCLMGPALDLYGRWVISSGLLDQIASKLELRSRRGIYSVAVVLWLMIWQRLQPKATMSAAVQQLRAGNGRVLLSDCRRVREGRISGQAGGYCQGIAKMPKLVPELVTRDIVRRLSSELGGPWPGLAGPVYVIDGTTLPLPHTRKLSRAYPPARNQFGAGHWPMLRIVVLHDVSSGMALYPQWGAANGKACVSEQALAARAFEQLPAGATVMGDRNFGVFSMAWEATHWQRDIVVSLTEVRAKRIFGGPISQAGDYAVEWKSRRWDRAQASPWPEGASVPGRLIAARVGRGKSKKWLYLFTTLALPQSEVVALYGQRWNIETDLRALKRTVAIQQLRSRSADGLEKELLTAVCAYNMVRAVMCMASRRSGVPVRRLSFTNVFHLVETVWPTLVRTQSKEDHDREFERMLDIAAEYKLPIRGTHRHYPREVWRRDTSFPDRKTK